MSSLQHEDQADARTSVTEKKLTEDWQEVAVEFDVQQAGVVGSLSTLPSDSGTDTPSGGSVDSPIDDADVSIHPTPGKADGGPGCDATSLDAGSFSTTAALAPEPGSESDDDDDDDEEVEEELEEENDFDDHDDECEAQDDSDDAHDDEVQGEEEDEEHNKHDQDNDPGAPCIGDGSVVSVVQDASNEDEASDVESEEEDESDSESSSDSSDSGSESGSSSSSSSDSEDEQLGVEERDQDRASVSVLPAHNYTIKKPLSPAFVLGPWVLLLVLTMPAMLCATGTMDSVGSLLRNYFGLDLGETGYCLHRPDLLYVVRWGVGTALGYVLVLGLASRRIFPAVAVLVLVSALNRAHPDYIALSTLVDYHGNEGLPVCVTPADSHTTAEASSSSEESPRRAPSPIKPTRNVPATKSKARSTENNNEQIVALENDLKFAVESLDKCTQSLGNVKKLTRLRESELVDLRAAHDDSQALVERNFKRLIGRHAKAKKKISRLEKRLDRALEICGSWCHGI
jgi:hypothetical protein